MRLLLLALLLSSALRSLAPGNLPALPTERFVEDMRSKNLDDVLSLYTPDAVFVDPEGHTFATAAALRKLYEQVFATFDSDIHLASAGLEASGADRDNVTAAVDSGTYVEDLRTRATSITQHLCGTYRFSYKRRTASDPWLIARMEWTSTRCPTSPVK